MTDKFERYFFWIKSQDLRKFPKFQFGCLRSSGTLSWGHGEKEGGWINKDSVTNN